MALTIDPENVPMILFWIFEDEDGDRWMAPGTLRIKENDGTTIERAVDDGSGGAFRIGTDTGALFFRVDLDEDGISTGITGPTIDTAVPADVLPAPGVAGEFYWLIATINSTTPADWVQELSGLVTWNNAPATVPVRSVAVIFQNEDMDEVGRFVVEDGRVVLSRDLYVNTILPPTPGVGP